ncbi:MAG: hypothetical protein IKQ62_08135, partial [Bacteroidaceae bacterium]|nr:hypothetical protein [Bacteroidaceae bacterium]
IVFCPTGQASCTYRSLSLRIKGMTCFTRGSVHRTRKMQDAESSRAAALSFVRNLSKSYLQGLPLGKRVQRYALFEYRQNISEGFF